MLSLDEDVRSFWYSMLSLGGHAQRTRWGVVCSDARYRRVYDANHASVLEPMVDLTLEEIEESLLPALRASGTNVEHVEFMDPVAATSPAAAALRAAGATEDPDVVMVFEGPHAEVSTDASVEEVEEPTADLWPVLRLGPNQYGQPLPDDVLDQMAVRTREVLVPAGLRYFVGSLDGVVAGFAWLLSLDGVGYVGDVITLPESRRRGVASAVVTSIVRTALHEGDRKVFLLAEENGDPQRLYERLGFRVSSRTLSFTRRLATL